MNVGYSRCSELRGFTTTAYYEGSDGNLAGGDQNLVVSLLVRVLDQEQNDTEVLAENFEGVDGVNGAGWSVTRETDGASGFNDTVVFSAAMFGGAVTARATVEMVRSFALGRILRLDMLYDTNTQTVSLLINGQVCRTNQQLTLTPVASTAAPTIGARRGGTLPATNTAILAVAVDENANALAGAATLPSFIEGLKRADIVDSGVLVYDHKYTARNLAGFAGKSGAGYPRTLADVVGTQDMTKQGNGALTVGTPQVIWGVARNETQPQ